MTAPEYGPPRRVYGECDCGFMRVGSHALDCPAHNEQPVIAYERDRLVDAHYTGPESIPEIMDPAKRHPGKVVAKCPRCVGGPTRTWTAEGFKAEGEEGWEPCPDCRGTGVETQRLSRERVDAALLALVKGAQAVPKAMNELVLRDLDEAYNTLYWAIDAGRHALSPQSRPFDVNEDEAGMVVAILEAGLL